MKRDRSLLLGLALLGIAVANAASPPQLGPPYTLTGGFTRPFGLGVDNTNGRLLVADTANFRFQWTAISTLNGAYSFTPVGFVANRNDAAALNDPQAIAADAAGNVYVANTLTGNVKQYNWNGGTYAINQNFCNQNPHTVNGKDIKLPRDIAVGPDGSIYLLDSGNNRILKAAGASAISWTEFKVDNTWSNPYGLDVDGAGNVYVADTGNHRIIKISGNNTTTFGHFGTQDGEFRYPRDVAVDSQGRMYVADTFNHRIQVLGPDGFHLLNVGHAPGLGTIDKIVVDASGKVYIVDSDNNQVLAFLGPGAAPFDLYFRDFVGDSGAEPSNGNFQISSPDVLIRHQPDIDLTAAAQSGLDAFAFQQPRYNENNYVYVAAHNRGKQQALDNFITLYYYDPGTPGSFPGDWKASGFYSSYADGTHNQPGNSILVPVVAPGGFAVVGPVIWRPPTPESAIAADGNFRLAARVSNQFDEAPAGPVTGSPRSSNDVTERRVQVVRGPFAAGDQNTLMVRVHYSDLMATTDQATVEQRAAELASWIKETSWGEANVTVLQRGPVVPPHASTYYADPSNHLLVEMVQDVLDKLLVSEPNLLDGSGPGHEIGRIVLVTNDLANTRDWATTGSWPYMAGGKQRYITASVQGGNNPTALFTHGMSHQLNLVDLYAYDNVTFPRPYVDGWDNMAKPFNEAHPLTWSKELATWVTAHNSKIFFVPRPAPGTTWNNGGQPIPLNYQETAQPGQTVAVAFGLTNGLTSLADETAFYFVEARSKQGPGADTVLPQTGVLMYYANSQIPQGQGPVILRDHVPGGDLTDAAIPIGGSEAPGGTGISVQVQAGTNGADYNLAVQYNPPATDYDVLMHPGDPNYVSPDIWADNQKDGYDEDNNRPPQDRGNQAIAGEDNRIYARVFNSGPADAFDVEVAFSFSEPYHTVAGQPAFDFYKSVFIDKIPSGQNVPKYVTWKPKTGIDPHTCVRVDLRRLFNDTNSANNWAQHNFQIDHSVHGSPYTPVDFPFQVRNTTATAQLIYFRTEGIPADWVWSITPSKALVQPGSMATAKLHMQPPPTTPDCMSKTIFVTGWTPQGDTLVRLGGTTVKVDLQQKTAVDLRLAYDKCTKGDDKNPAGVPALLVTNTSRSCLRVVASGCTNPKRPNQDITLRYEGPDGKPVYHAVHTDANGCYQDFNVVTEGGDWTATVEYDGNVCAGPAVSSDTEQVPLPTVDHPEGPLPDPERTLCIRTISLNGSGGSSPKRAESAKSTGCRTTASEREIRLQVRTSGLYPDQGSAFDGDLLLSNVRTLFSMGAGTPGLVRGRFEWKVKSGRILGRIEGLLDRGTHRVNLTTCAGCTENRGVARHWELSLDGTMVEGPAAGSRVRAVVVLELGAEPRIPTAGPAGATVQATIEGVVETDCGMSPAALKARIERAVSEAAKPPLGACNSLLPCLKPIAKVGSGRLTLDQTGRSSCDRDKCVTAKTWSTLVADLKSDGEGPSPALADGTLKMASLFQIYAGGYMGRAEHGGTFIYEAANGRVEGQLIGISRGGSHRKPLTNGFESFDRRDHWEGELTGKIIAGNLKGQSVEARYVLDILNVRGRRSEIRMAVGGWVVKGCMEAPGPVQTTEVRPTAVGVINTPQAVPVRPSLDLPERIYRPLSALPASAVDSYRRAQGKALTPNDERALRIADQRFRTLDRANRGYLDQQTVVEDTSPTAQRADAQIPKVMLARFDANHDGVITSAEAGKAWTGLQELDLNKDGRLTSDELKGAGRMYRVRQFKTMDANHDGKVDFTEYVLWFRTLPSPALKKP